MMNDFTNHGDTMKTSATPEPYNLFNTREYLIIIEDTQAKIHNNFISKALFVANRSSPDIHTTVAFISTQARVPK